MPRGVYGRTSYHAKAMRRGKRVVRETLDWLRRCCRCGLEAKSKDDLSLFVPSKKNPHGRYNLCRECSNKATQIRQTELRAKANELKHVPCMDCHVLFPPECMDFDHVRGEKLFDVSVGVSGARPWELILTEIAKCDIVCSNCHRIRTKRRLK